MILWCKWVSAKIEKCQKLLTKSLFPLFSHLVPFSFCFNNCFSFVLLTLIFFIIVCVWFFFYVLFFIFSKNYLIFKILAFILFLFPITQGWWSTRRIQDTAYENWCDLKLSCVLWILNYHKTRCKVFSHKIPNKIRTIPTFTRYSLTKNN